MIVRDCAASRFGARFRVIVTELHAPGEQLTVMPRVTCEVLWKCCGSAWKCCGSVGKQDSRR